MLALAEPCQRRREDAMSLVAETVGDVAPAPAAMPGTVDENIYP